MKRTRAKVIAATTVARSNVELGEKIANSNRELGNKLEKISNAEIKAKDRVDIPLEEYERMKNQIATLESQNNQMSLILRKLNIPVELIEKIILGSIETYYTDDPIIDNPFDRRRRFRITFDVPKDAM